MRKKLLIIGIILAALSFILALTSTYVQYSKIGVENYSIIVKPLTVVRRVFTFEYPALLRISSNMCIVDIELVDIDTFRSYILKCEDIVSVPAGDYILTLNNTGFRSVNVNVKVVFYSVKREFAILAVPAFVLCVVSIFVILQSLRREF